MTCIVSSQQATPPPRSLAHCHQPLRGVMMTSGGKLALLPAIVAVTLKARVAVRTAVATTAASACAAACSCSHPASVLDTCSMGGPDGVLNDNALSRKRP